MTEPAPKTQADAYFAIGRTHHVCQDYAAAQPLLDGSALVVLSDGCSSSKHTDFGARFLVRAALRNKTLMGWDTDLPTTHREVIRHVIQEAACGARGSGVELECLDATLLTALVDERGWLTVTAFGDGVVDLEYADGSHRVTEISFSKEAPAYPSYLLDEERLATYLRLAGRRKILRTTCSPGSLTTPGIIHTQELHQERVNDGTGFGLLVCQTTWAQVKRVTLFSDGVLSFRRSACEVVPGMDVLAQLGDIKSPTGSFMTRRVRKFLHEFCPKNGWTHDDDLSVASIVNPEAFA